MTLSQRHIQTCEGSGQLSVVEAPYLGILKINKTYFQISTTVHFCKEMHRILIFPQNFQWVLRKSRKLRERIGIQTPMALALKVCEK